MAHREGRPPLNDAALRRAVDVRVLGLVQGVSFRFYATRAARETGVAGWVRNEVDGSVRGHFEGSPTAVEAMVAWCHQGSPYASVESVEVSEAEATGATTFTVDG